MKGLHICNFKSEPGKKECLEAIWSQGGSCKKCQENCYRKGYGKQMAAADNRKLCLVNH